MAIRRALVRRLDFWISVAVALGALGLILLIGIRWEAYQWDFYMFRRSALEMMQGVDPYRGEGLSFFHPPLMTYVYRPFTWLPLSLAYWAWYTLKLAALGGLLALWNARFLKLSVRWPTVLFLVLAYNGAIYADLVAGNVSVFEELGIWLAFACLMQQRFALFALLIAVTAQIKITPVLLALALVFVPERPQWRWLVITVLGFGAVFSLNFWLEPDMFRRFIEVSGMLDERGTDNASLLAFSRDAVELVSGASYGAVTYVDELLYLGIIAIVGTLSLLVLLVYRARASRRDEVLLICFICVVFALASPRLKGYTYILLLLPTLYLLRAQWRSLLVPAGALFIATLVMFPLPESLLPIRAAFGLLNEYIPLVACAMVWCGYCDLLWQRAGHESMLTRLGDLAGQRGALPASTPPERG